MIELDKCLPVIHFGPTYPPEDAYYRKLLSYTSAVKCCRLNGHYRPDTESHIPWDTGTRLANHREDRVRNLAYFMYIDAGSPPEQNLQYWHLAEKLVSKYEELMDSMISNKGGRWDPQICSG